MRKIENPLSVLFSRLFRIFSELLQIIWEHLCEPLLTIGITKLGLDIAYTFIVRMIIVLSVMAFVATKTAIHAILYSNKLTFAIVWSLRGRQWEVSTQYAALKFLYSFLYLWHLGFLIAVIYLLVMVKREWSELTNDAECQKRNAEYELQFENMLVWGQTLRIYRIRNKAILKSQGMWYNDDMQDSQIGWPHYDAWAEVDKRIDAELRGHPSSILQHTPKLPIPEQSRMSKIILKWKKIFTRSG